MTVTKFTEKNILDMEQEHEDFKLIIKQLEYDIWECIIPNCKLSGQKSDILINKGTNIYEAIAHLCKNLSNKKVIIGEKEYDFTNIMFTYSPSEIDFLLGDFDFDSNK